MSDTASTAMLERRRIEAKLLAHVHAVLSERHGEQAANEVVAESVRRSAIEQGAEMAAALGGKTSLQTFIDAQELWTRGDALEIALKEQSAERFAFDVKRCAYAEMYRGMGLGKIGHLLSCQRDGTFCEGYDKRLKLKRSQTIMQGATHCDFEYTYEAASDPSAVRPKA
ncbi:MAG: L-2-amino-thiazoline-4-carboxylic acid hydrolase [Hyphomicrobiaceae bacterium]|nr:L-2-amino-thiazoline-4-carboxylic acid hydrolase [Hyphomicrobiaceae bacterium]